MFSMGVHLFYFADQGKNRVLMDIAKKRAFLVKTYLKAQGLEIQGGNETPDGYALAVLVNRDGVDYISVINLIGNAVTINVLVDFFDKDFSGSKEGASLVNDGWMICAAVVNAKLDGLCALTINFTDEASMYVSGVTKGYYLETVGLGEYVYKLFIRALINTVTAISLTGIFFESLENEKVE